MPSRPAYNQTVQHRSDGLPASTKVVTKKVRFELEGLLAVKRSTKEFTLTNVISRSINWLLLAMQVSIRKTRLKKDSILLSEFNMKTRTLRKFSTKL